ncbi:hypothetical protein GFS31_07870 [Leptolyngbya sp. BL0902]|nr:hypothetical protein GFS31_07870 [Leptolyngbya sp. BL0902]
MGITAKSIVRGKFGFSTNHKGDDLQQDPLKSWKPPLGQ